MDLLNKKLFRDRSNSMGSRRIARERGCFERAIIGLSGDGEIGKSQEEEESTKIIRLKKKPNETIKIVIEIE